MSGGMAMADHWWFRPGWSIGRRFYTWHLTFAGGACGDLHRLAGEYRKALAPLPGLNLIPDRWLHLTMQGLGFVDEVDDGDVDAIVASAQQRLAEVPAFDLEFDRPIITPEAIQWRTDPTGPAAVRDAIRAAIGDVWPEVPEPPGGFKAHVSIAYSNSDGPAAPVQQALDHVRAEPAVVPVVAADLIVLRRDNHAYEWDTHATAHLGPDRPTA